ncbi:hypothetical protein [Spiroplasma endosymbiont of Danaus chrysippus]|uniref:hypothetical protein n=1 Tax=Spiroplasma endosymbiont of Danaus chrysippus TaxID=2691041 RepID=UPI0013C873A1|nr:hypothetical protein [Spiroplasma endosymbiont of Danaus chrysippus]CAB1053575.1 hypothetical protein [Spiroplasma endosymbiont of Danaus chrysippus]
METNNYTLTKLIRIGISPICAMIGTSAYYGQVIANPILGSINSLLFGKKLGLDIWNLNQRPNTKTKLINSSKKILLGLGTIGLVNYSKFVTNNINPNPTENPITTTTVDPFPPDLLFVVNNNPNNLMDWDTFISLNSYGIASLVAGITELIPNRFESIRRITNIATGGCLISSGVAMGINNDFNNAYAVPTIIAGASEIIHNLLPMETTNHIQEIQETPFNNETARLVNDNVSNYGSDISEILFDRDNASLNWDYSHHHL